MIDGDLEASGQVLGSGDQARIEGARELKFLPKRPSEIALIDLP